MMVICVMLTLCFWAGINGQMNENSSPEPFTNKNISSQSISNKRNYDYDPQIRGFNSTKITSGPLVLADKRTLFISNLQYQGSEDVLIFYAGIGSPYNNQKANVAEEYFLVNHTNLYIKLPETLSLDVIDFFGVSVKNSQDLLDYVIFEKINRSAVKDYQEQMEDTIFRIPKCCQHNEYLTTTAKGCVEADEINLHINIFESNETGLDPDVRLNASDYKIRPYFQGLLCTQDEFRLEVGDELHGLIYNSSLIIKGSGILSHGEYCIDVINDEGNVQTNALFCYPKPIETSDPNLYVPVLIISTICFAISAAAYGVILRAKDVHKLSFVVFSSSMCLTCLSLIILQIQNNVTACNIFGFVFLFSTIFSFLWLLILCIELLYLVRIPLERNRNNQRWYWYVGTSFGVSTLLFVVSLFSGNIWVPDVPNSFIKNYGSNQCAFETTFGRAFIIFVPMILSIVMSVACLIVLRKFINRNEKSKEIKSHIDWMENSNSYKFLSRTYFIIIAVASFWLSNLIFYSSQLGSAKTQLALDIIEASVGVVTLIAFVLNKYTLAEIRDKIWKKKRAVTEEGLGLNGIPTPETPAANSDDPFIRPHYRNANR